MARDPAPHLRALAREGRLVADAARGSLDHPVPACPGWTVASVLGHLGRVYRSVTAHVVTRAEAPVPGDAIPRPPEGPQVITWFEQAHAAALVALTDIGPDEPVWTWSDDRTGGFYHRRMANETLIHRIDVEQAVGATTPVEPEQAADAIPELYELLMPFALARRPRPLPSGSLHLRCTDGPWAWTVAARDGAVAITPGPGSATVEVAGPAGDLVRFVWHRGRADGLTVHGDEAVAAAWAELAP